MACSYHTKDLSKECYNICICLVVEALLESTQRPNIKLFLFIILKGVYHWKSGFQKNQQNSFKKTKKQKGYWCYTQQTCSSSLFEGGVTFDIQFVSGYFKICQQDGSIKYTLILMNKAGEVKKNLSLAFLPASFWYATSFFVLFCFLLFLFLLCRCVLKVGNNNKIVSFPFWFTENVKLKSANFYLNR